MEDFSYLRHLKDRNDMNPVAVRLLNQQLVIWAYPYAKST